MNNVQIGANGMGVGVGLGVNLRHVATVGNWWQSLFANGENGFIFPGFSNLAYLFQDSAGTTHVGATADPTGLVKDQSGKRNDALQTTAGARPLWQPNSGKPYLAFDAVSDTVLSSFVPTAAMTIAAAFRINASGSVAVGGGNTSGQRAYLGMSPTTNLLGGGWGAQNSAVITGGSSILSTNHVGILVADATNVSLYLDGVSVYSAAPSGSPAGAPQGMALGSIGGANSYLGGNVYAAMTMNRKATAAEIALINAKFRSTYS